VSHHVDVMRHVACNELMIVLKWNKVSKYGSHIKYAI